MQQAWWRCSSGRALARVFLNLLDGKGQRSLPQSSLPPSEPCGHGQRQVEERPDRAEDHVGESKTGTQLVVGWEN